MCVSLLYSLRGGFFLVWNGETYYPFSPIVLQLWGKFAGQIALAAIVMSVWSGFSAVIAAWKVPSTLYVVWARMGIAKRRVAKRVRIEGDDRRDILLLCVDLRYRDVSSSYRLSRYQAALR